MVNKKISDPVTNNKKWTLYQVMATRTVLARQAQTLYEIGEVSIIFKIWRPFTSLASVEKAEGKFDNCI